MEEASLEFLLKDYDLIYARRTQLELDVRASFLRFMACLFKGYRSYLLPITQAPSERTRDFSNLFNVEGKKEEKPRSLFFGKQTILIWTVTPTGGGHINPS